MTQETAKQTITGFFMLHWGVPTQFHIQEPDPLELAVIEFSPGRQSSTQTQLETSRFATNGMSVYDQGEGYRTELYVNARISAPWIIQLLVAFARYPMQYDVRLCERNTVPAAEAICRDKTLFTAFLIAEPGPEPHDPETLGVIPNAYPERVFVHQVVAITQAEYEFALKHDSEALWERLVNLGRPLLLDEARPDAILGH
jgi:hypothetical protein